MLEAGVPEPDGVDPFYTSARPADCCFSAAPLDVARPALPFDAAELVAPSVFSGSGEPDLPSFDWDDFANLL